MKLIQLITFLYAGFAAAQYCPALGPDQILPCGVGSTTLTADLSQCGAGTNPKQTTNYTATSIPYVAQTNTGTQLFMTDDSQQGPFNIGFSFCFYGQTYTQFYVGSNGWISFSAGQPTTFTSQPIPTANFLVPKNCIMGPWQDWHPGIGGQIRYQVQGVAPCRKLVVSWTNIPMFSCTSNQGTFHIVIHESTNVIENHIQNKPPCLQWQGGTATQGVHNAAGTMAVAVPGRNSTAWTAANDAYRWTPSGPTVTPTLTWYQVGNPVALGTGPTLIVTPPAGGAQYTCHLTYPTCNAGWSQCNGGTSNGPDTILVVPGPPIPVVGPIIGTDTICIGSNLEVYNITSQPGYNLLWSSIAPITSGQGTSSVSVDFSAFPASFIPGALQVTPEANGCIGLPTVFDVTIYQVIPIIQPEGPFCSYDPDITLQVQPLGGILSGLGVVGFNFEPNQAIGTNTITYTYQQSGCVFDTTTDIIVYPQPILDSIAPYNPFYEICEGDSVVLVFAAQSNIPGYSEWQYMGVTYQQDNITIPFTSPGMFPLSVTAWANGCVSAEQQTVVTIARCPELLFYIPNSFTPDGNEHNQVWLPVFTNGFDSYDYHVQIYNRWGECVFQSYNASEGWDGTYYQYNCQDGIYTYILVFGDKETDAKYTLTGHFNLIR